MSTSGYSGTTLINKLGIKAAMKVMLLNEPDNYVALLSTDLQRQLCKKNEVPDFAHLFARNRVEFEAGMKQLGPFVKKNSALLIWVSWYKKSSKIKTDITEDDVRNYALAHGLVDIKVCAVSEEWSGLKLVVPVALR